MKWAIFEFNDRSCEFGQTSRIQGEDAESFDNETWFFTKEIIVKILKMKDTQQKYLFVLYLCLLKCKLIYTYEK